MTEISSEPREEQREVPIATLGVRTLGAILDILVIVVVWSIYGVYFGEPPESGFGFRLEGLPVTLSFAAMFAYFAVTEAVWGATPGKMLAGMRVVNEEDGAVIGWRRSIVRNVLRVADVFPAFYLVGFFFAVSSPRTQRLGDRLARTVVIRI
jgi:uncharacterized RDD family membrane protein YckC